jgi:maltose alpha-D-glucosyltransferase/alpha-amylase
MLRSFAYAADTAARGVEQRVTDEAKPRVAQLAEDSRRFVEAAFLQAYDEVTDGTALWVSDKTTRANLLRLHLIAKALYEINYEAGNRPDWIETPVRGVLAILDQSGDQL